jgi:hypothetical protein
MSVLLQQSRALLQIHEVAEVFVPAGCRFNPRLPCVPQAWLPDVPSASVPATHPGFGNVTAVAARHKAMVAVREAAPDRSLLSSLAGGPGVAVSQDRVVPARRSKSDRASMRTTIAPMRSAAVDIDRPVEAAVCAAVAHGQERIATGAPQRAPQRAPTCGSVCSPDGIRTRATALRVPRENA